MKTKKSDRTVINILLIASFLSITIIWDPGMSTNSSTDKVSGILIFTLFFYTVAALIAMSHKLISYSLRFFGIFYALIFTSFLCVFIHCQIMEDFTYWDRTIELALISLIGLIWCCYTVFKNFTYKE